MYTYVYKYEKAAFTLNILKIIFARPVRWDQLKLGYAKLELSIQLSAGSIRYST